MGCSGYSERQEPKDESVKDQINIKLILEYIQLYQNLCKNIFPFKDDLYLIETDYFQALREYFSINLNDNILSNEEKLKKKSSSNKFNLVKQNIKIIIKEKDIKSDNIEIINEHILILLNYTKNEYENKMVKIINKNEKNLELQLKDNSHIKILITNEKKPFKIIKNIKDFQIKEKDEKINLIISPNHGTAFKYENIKIQRPLSSEILKINEQENVSKNEYKLLLKEKNNIKTNKNKSNNNKEKIKAYDENKLKVKCKLFYENYKELFNDLNDLNILLNNSIDSNNKSDKYAIITKKNFNYLTKLFESYSKFTDDNFIIDSFDKLTPIDKLDLNNNIEDRLNEFIYNDSFVHVEMNSYELTSFKYLDNFILIRKDLLSKFDIDENIIKNNEYNLLFGEKFLFVEINKSCNKEILICSRDNFFFNTNIIISCLDNNYFENELMPNIKGRKGFDYFFNKIKFDINNQQFFRHMLDEDPIAEIQIIKYLPNKIEEMKEIGNENEIKMDPILKQTIISLYYIKPLNEFLGNIEIENKDVASLFIKFIHEFKSNYENGLNSIKDIEDIMITKKVKYNFKDIIDFILDNIHYRLGGTIFEDNIEQIEENDKNFIISVFKNNIKNNNSLIKDIFYGIILSTITKECCQGKIYKCKLSKSIYLEYNDIKNFDNINDILEHWGNTTDNNYLCGKCLTNVEAKISSSFVEYPQILIIILNDEDEQNRKSIKFPVQLNVNKFAFNYKLICAITSKEKFDINYNIIKYENDNWSLFDKTDKKIDKKDFEIYSKYPKVLFYEKIKESEKKLDYSQTEKDVESFFNGSLITKKEVGISNENSILKNISYASFNLPNDNNRYANENDLNNNQYPNNFPNLNEEEKKIFQEYIKKYNKTLAKEEIEKIIYNNRTKNNEMYNDISFDNCKGTLKISKNPQLLINNNKNLIYENMDNMNINNNSNNIFIQNNFIYNPYNVSVNSNQTFKYNNKDNNEINNSNIDNNKIEEKKEIKLKFVYNGYCFSLTLYDNKLVFKDVIQMLKDQIPEIDDINFIYLTLGKNINVYKTIKENEIIDGCVISIVQIQKSNDN